MPWEPRGIFHASSAVSENLVFRRAIITCMTGVANKHANRDRGISILPVLFVVGLIIVGVSSYFIFSKKKPDVVAQPVAIAQTDAPEEIPVDSFETQSLISFDPFVYTSPSGVYFRTITPAASSAKSGSPDNTPKDAAAKNVGVYLLIPGADPASFSEIKKLPIKNPTVTEKGATSEMTYYRDSDQVFVAQTTTHVSGDADTSVAPVDADPATFQILNDTYAKDAGHVYVVSWVCQGETCTLVLVVVVGADPATFHVIDETTIQKSNGSGIVTADAVDSTHLFNNGVIVDTTTTPGSNESDLTPVLISP